MYAYPSQTFMRPVLFLYCVNPFAIVLPPIFGMTDSHAVYWYLYLLTETIHGGANGMSLMVSLKMEWPSLAVLLFLYMLYSICMLSLVLIFGHPMTTR